MIKIIKPNNIYIKFINYLSINFIKLITEQNYIILKLHDNTKILNNNIYTNQNNIKHIITWLLNNNIIINKISFFGRGYKIITKYKKNLLIFNKSHIVVLYSNDLILKYDKKSLLIINSNLINKKYINNIYNLKMNNIYKKLGIRKNKKIILKKKGKNVTS